MLLKCVSNVNLPILPPQCAPPTATANPDLTTEQSNRAANQAKLLAAGALDALAAVALQAGGMASPHVRAAALRALGDLTAGQAAAQERLAHTPVRPGPLSLAVRAAGGSGMAWQGAAGGGMPGESHIPALQAALHVALYGSSGEERAAADHVVGCYCLGNAEGQAALAATVGAAGGPAGGGGVAGGIGMHGQGHGAGQWGAAPGGGGGLPAADSTFGSDLVAALLGQGPEVGPAGELLGIGGGGGEGGGGAGAPPGHYRKGSWGAGGGGGAVAGAGAGAVGQLLVCCRAAGVLQHVLYGNPVAKGRLMAVPLEAQGPAGQPPEYLMPRWGLPAVWTWAS